MDDVLGGPYFAKPSASEKTLSSHVADANVSSVDRKLLETRYPTPVVLADGLIANSGESLRKQTRIRLGGIAWIEWSP